MLETIIWPAQTSHQKAIPMKIVADENIPLVKEIFGRFGRIYCYPGRNLTAGIVQDADVLLVRSITPVNEPLLKDSKVRFVGTATIGTDHIDLDYLTKRNIRFTSAAGSNANSVAEYVMTALLQVAQRRAIVLEGKTLGIIGVGNIGSIIHRIAPALGLKTLLNDPPLARQSGVARYIGLNELLDRSDIITCHTPLNKSGPDCTVHLIDAAKLARLRPDTILVNAARGPVVENQALKAALAAKAIGPVILDVWEPEPALDPELLKLTDIATPHIAGYSFEGKINGTTILYQKLCEFLDTDAQLDIAHLLPKPALPEFYLDNRGQSHQEMLYQAMTALYDLDRDDRALRQSMDLPGANRSVAFDQLRKTYPIRREARHTRVLLTEPDEILRNKLQTLGFQL